MNQKFYYIEVQEGEEVIRRDKTSYGNMNHDWSRIQNYYPERDVRMIVSSDKEKVFNKIPEAVL